MANIKNKIPLKTIAVVHNRWNFLFQAFSSPTAAATDGEFLDNSTRK